MSHQIEDLAHLLSETLRTDPSAALDKDMLERLAYAYMDDPRKWHECKVVLKQYRMVRDVEPHVKMLVREFNQIPSIGGLADAEPSISEVWPDAPVGDDVYAPSNYSIQQGTPAIERIESRMLNDMPVQKRVPVCLDPLVITRRIGNTQTKEISLEVQFRTGAGWRKTIVDRSTMLNARKIVDTAQLGLPVASDNAMELVSWVRHYEHCNRDHIPLGYASNRMGWQGDDENRTRHGFICGLQQIGGNGLAVELDGGSGDMAEARDVRTRGTFEGWRNAVRRLAHFPAVRIALCASLASVLIAVVDGPNGVVEWAGRTSTGKSTVLRVAQSCWRSAATPMATWNSTIIGVEAVAHFFCDLPLIIDDTSTAVEGGRSQSLGKVIYQLVSGRARGRATRHGSQKLRNRWRTMVLASGETPLGELAKAEGASARVLTFWSAPLGASNPDTGALVNSCMRELAENSGHAGPRVIQWLCSNRDRWDDIRAMYSEATSRLRREVCTPAASRLAEIVALLECAAWVGAEAGCLPWQPTRLLDERELLDAIRGAVDIATASSDRAYDAWEHLMGDAESRPKSWHPWGEHPKADRDPVGGWLGYVNFGGGEYAWFPSQLNKALENAGFTPAAVLRAWKDLGVIRGCERQRFVGRCRPFGTREQKRLIRVAMTYPGVEVEDDADEQ